MATIAIGDVHGNLPALVDLLEQLRFEVAAGDTVVLLGDYVDRGPDSRQCIDAILDFRARIPAEVVCLCGNHEDWLLRTQSDYTRHSWLFGMDAFDTVASYSPDAVRILCEAMGAQGARVFARPACALPYEAFFDAWPPSHVEFFAKLALCIETADCICSHARSFRAPGTPLRGAPHGATLTAFGITSRSEATAPPSGPPRRRSGGVDCRLVGLPRKP